MVLEMELQRAKKRISELEKKNLNVNEKLEKTKSRFSALRAKEKKREKNESKSNLSVSSKDQTK